jgi:hypothetical protein
LIGEGLYENSENVLFSRRLSMVSAIPVAGNRRKWVDYLVVLACILGAGVFFLLFWLDMNRTLEKIGETPIATVTYKNKVAQRRFMNRMIWDLLKRDSSMYHGDVLHTADLSDATIMFSDGAVMDLGENTHVQIFWTATGPKVELASGNANVQAGTSGGIILSSNGQDVVVESGSMLSATTTASGDTNMQVLQGAATVGNQALAEGDALAMTKTGVVYPAQVIVRTPLPNETIVSVSDAPGDVRFAWTTSNFTDENQTLVEIALDRRFSRMVRRHLVDGETEWSTALGASTYWWRVYPVTVRTALSGDDPARVLDGQTLVDVSMAETAATQKLMLMRAILPTPLYPEANAAVTYKEDNRAIRFQWNPNIQNSTVQHPAGYRVQVSGSETMMNPRVDTLVNNPFFITDELPEGAWYWRVEPLYEGVAAGQLISTPVRFTFFQETELPSMPVQLDGEGLSGSQAAMFVLGRDTPVLRWNSESVMQTFRLVVSRSPNPLTDASNGSAVFDIRTNGQSEIRLPALDEGEYFWTIIAKNERGEDVSALRPASFRILPRILFDPPTLRSPAGTANAPYRLSPAMVQDSRSLLFAWDAVPEANAYILTITGGSMARLDSRFVFATSYTFPDIADLGDGAFSYTVEAVLVEPNGLIRRRGTPAVGYFAIDVSRPAAPRIVPPGVLYGEQ